MNHWLQAKLYECPRCRATYLHDKAYHHDLFQCVRRENMTLFLREKVKR